MAFDAEAVREQFPILARQVNGKPPYQVTIGNPEPMA